MKASEALAEMKNGQRVFIGSGCAQPQHLVAALADRVAELYDIEIVHILTVGDAPYTDPKFAGHVRHNSFFIGPNVRDAIERGDADYTPANLSDIPRLFRTGQFRLDWALIQVSAPDRHGYCSLGVSVDVVRGAIESARRVVAQVNPRMPRTHGDTLVRLRDLHHVVEFEEPILELSAREPDETAQQIGRYIASLIEDESTIQAGIGVIPNAALRLLKTRRDLGVHTEMLSDWAMELIEAGAITNRRKTLHPGKTVTSFAMGSRKLYDYIDDNPFFEFRGSDHVNDPAIIAQNRKMVSINSALQVDLTGQVCADSLGTKFYSGIGGQVDFVRGATHSPGGKSIIALPSTASGGTVSRIAPVLTEGSGVVTARADVHYIVTEFGIAELLGRTIRERALALISVAHPKFREGLLAAAKGRHISVPMPKAQKYPVELETRLQGFFARPIRPQDEDLLRELFYSHSEETIYHRYGTPLRRLPPEMIHKLVNIDYDREMAIAVFAGEAPEERMIAVARYFVDESGFAEAAFTVHDGFQGKGLGTAIFKNLCEIAKSRGLKGLYGHVRADNIRMLRVFHSAGFPVRTHLDRDLYKVTVEFTAPASA